MSPNPLAAKGELHHGLAACRMPRAFSRCSSSSRRRNTALSCARMGLADLWPSSQKIRQKDLVQMGPLKVMAPACLAVHV